MEEVVLNSARYEDPTAIVCPVRTVCVAAFFPYLNRLLGLGGPKMLSPEQCGQLKWVRLNLLRLPAGVALTHSAGGGQMWKAASLKFGRLPCHISLCAQVSWLKQMAAQALRNTPSPCDLNGKMCQSIDALLPSA